MRNYELTLIISSEIPEQDLKNLIEKISGFIIKEGGKIEKTIEPLRKKLGYPIKKKVDGFITVLIFSLVPEKLEILEKELKKENQILRYLISIAKKKEELPIKKIKITPQKTTEPKKVELKEIDKKIEEILKE